MPRFTSDAAIPRRSGLRTVAARVLWGVVVVGLTACGPSSPPVASQVPGNVEATNRPADAVSARTVDPKILQGKWERPDGGYVIDVRTVDAASGRLEVAYLNPQPIHVSRAEAKVEEGRLKVFVELQDVNYPGCTYRLTYLPGADRLYGVYYQAAVDQSFDVEFERLR